LCLYSIWQPFPAVVDVVSVLRPSDRVRPPHVQRGHSAPMVEHAGVVTSARVAVCPAATAVVVHHVAVGGICIVNVGRVDAAAAGGRVKVTAEHEVGEVVVVGTAAVAQRTEIYRLLVLQNL
jgi:hypothetical protein